MEITLHVTFHGFVRNPSEYYLKAGVFVMTSDFEGTPNALLEAMAHGLPSVVADCLPGALQFIRDGENGLRSEEHTSELQSRGHLVCRLLLEKKKIRRDE